MYKQRNSKKKFLDRLNAALIWSAFLYIVAVADKEREIEKGPCGCSSSLHFPEGQI